MLPLIKKALIAVASYTAVIVFIMLVDDSLFDASVRWIRKLSRNWHSKTEEFFQVFTNLGIGIIAAPATLYALLNGPKIKQIMFIDAILLTAGLVPFLKNIHHKLRPSWAAKDIPVIVSETDYGNPSGHSAITMTLLFSGLILYWFDHLDFALTQAEVKIMKEKSKFWYSFPAKIIITFISILILATIMFSRVYLGAHGFNQVIYGFLLGILSPLMVFTLFRAELVSMYKLLLSKETILQHKKYAIIFSIMFVVLLLVNVFTYIGLNGGGVKLDEETLKHIQEGLPQFEADTPLNYGFINSGFVYGIIAIHLGIILSHHYHPIDPTRITFDIIWWKKIVRFLWVCVFVGLIPCLLILLIPASPVGVSAVFKTMIPTTVLGTAFFAIGDYLMDKINMLPLAPEDQDSLIVKEQQLSDVVVNKQ